MTIHVWWLYFVAVFLLVCTPGPNMLFVMSNSVRFGFIKSIPAMAGCWVAVALVLIASAAGLSAVLLASPHLFDALRYAGVAYLFYLGIKSWRSRDTAAETGSQSTAKPSTIALFRSGIAVGASNPKLFIFASAFFPQFVNQSAPQFPQFAILIVTFAMIELFWYAVYGLGGQKLAQLLKRPAMMRAFNALTGMIFIGFGLALLLTKVSR